MILEIFGYKDEPTERLEGAVRDALDVLGLAGEATIFRVEDPASMVGRGIWRAPGLAVNGKVVARGKVLTAAEARELIGSAAG
jgi:hypothetical protein